MTWRDVRWLAIVFGTSGNILFLCDCVGRLLIIFCSSLVIILPVAILLLLSYNQFHWYFCPISVQERLNDLMESKGGKKKSSSSSSSSSNSQFYEAPLGFIIEDVRPNGGIKKFRSAAYSNVSFFVDDILVLASNTYP